MNDLRAAARAAARALRRCGIHHPLPEAALLEVSGPDAARFLQAMCTQDLSRLGPGELAYSALADDRGRYQADFWVWRAGDGWLIEVAAGLAQPLARRLTLFAVSDEVTIGPAPCSGLFHLEGPAARESARRLGAPAVAETGVSGVETGGERGWAAVRSRYGEPGATFALAPGAAGDFADRLEREARRAGLTAAGETSRDSLRLEAGRPLGGVDVGEEDLVPEAGLAAAVSLAKGCYPGQETLQRVARRGELRRRLGGVLLGDVPAAAVLAGAPVEDAEGRPLGRITSAAYSPTRDATAALAWLSAGAWAEGTPLRVRAPGGLFAGRSSGLPFVEGTGGLLAEVPRYPERTSTPR